MKINSKTLLALVATLVFMTNIFSIFTVNADDVEIYDNFTSYTVDNTEFNETVTGEVSGLKYIGLTTSNNAGFDWKNLPLLESPLGTFWLDKSNEPTAFSYSYVNTEEDGLVVIREGSDTDHLVVNLNPNENKIENMNSITVKYTGNYKYTSAGIGFRLFVDSETNSYYTFGTSVKGSHTVHNGVSANRPFVSKTVNGVEKVLDIGWSLSGITYKCDYEWNITIEGEPEGLKKINWSVTMHNHNNGSLMESWNGWLIDGDTNIYEKDADGSIISSSSIPETDASYKVRKAEIINDNYTYPISLISSGTGGAIYTYLSLAHLDSLCAPNENPTAFCANVVEGSEADENSIIRFNQSAGASVWAINWENNGSEKLWLSEDGENFDTEVVLDRNGKWFSNDSTVYKYIKTEAGVDVSKLMVFSNLSLQTFKYYPKKTFHIYALEKADLIPGVSYSMSANEIAEFVESNLIKATNTGVFELEMVAPSKLLKKKATIEITDRYSEVLESGSQDLANEYVTEQQEIIDVLNGYINNEDKAAVKNFFIYDEDAEYNIAAIHAVKSALVDTLSKSENEELLNAFADKLMSYSDDIKVTSLEELKDLNNVFEKEIATDLVDKAVPSGEGETEAEAFSKALEANNNILKLPVDNKYYIEYKEECDALLAQKDYKNYEEFKTEFTHAYVLETYKGAGVGYEYYANALCDMQEEIGYDDEKFAKIEDKSALAKYILDDEDGYTTVNDIKDAIDSYEEKSSDNEEDDDDDDYRGGGGSSVTVSNKKGSSYGGGSVSIKPVTQPVVDNVQLFDDVSTDYWGYEAIRFMTSKGAANGYEDGTFCPDNKVTRAEFVKLAVTAAGILVATEETDEDDKIPVFNDVKKSDWFYPHLKAAKESGILNGDNNGNANPNVFVTKEECAAILYRLMTTQNITLENVASLVRFNDEREISDWALYAVTQLQAKGVVTGYNGTFGPKNSATRAESCKMIYEIIHKGVK